jgi:DNA-binding XRE family transcriptional regulator
MRLTERRKAVGYTQEQLADQLGVERSTVARWEHAETEPLPWIRPLLASALRVSPDELEELLATVDLITAGQDGTPLPGVAPVPVRSGRDPVLAAPWTHRGTVDASVRLSGGGDPVERRVFLYLTGAALTAPAHQWLEREPSVVRTLRTGGRVSAALADRLPAVIAELRLVDDVAGGGNVLPFVRQGFGWVARLLDRSAHDGPTGRKLHLALAELGHLAGWAGYDAEQHALAQRYFVAGLHAAHDVDDRALGAHILGSMAYQAAHHGRPADAVTLIDTALTGVRGRASHGLLAELHIRQAYGFATLGDAAATTAAIGRALAHTERLGTEPEPPWLYWVRPGEITAGAGNCLLRLGRPGTRVLRPAGRHPRLRPLVRPRPRPLPRTAGGRPRAAGAAARSRGGRPPRDRGGRDRRRALVRTQPHPDPRAVDHPRVPRRRPRRPGLPGEGTHGAVELTGLRRRSRGTRRPRG